MRLHILLLILTFACITPAPAQRAQPSPTMLMGPEDWRFERLPIPPGFARDIPWTGYEEARFSPGMFDPKSATYFTYALSISIDGRTQHDGGTWQGHEAGSSGV